MSRSGNADATRNARRSRRCRRASAVDGNALTSWKPPELYQKLWMGLRIRRRTSGGAWAETIEWLMGEFEIRPPRDVDSANWHRATASPQRSRVTQTRALSR